MAEFLQPLCQNNAETIGQAGALQIKTVTQSPQTWTVLRKPMI